MAFDASGTFTRLRGNDSWKGDATAGTKIKSDLHDDNDNDLANGLSECITRSGKSPPTADIPWGGYKITNLAAPAASTDAATKAYVDSTVSGSSYAPPIGAGMEYWGPTPPAKWLLAHGQALSRVTYSALFAVMGTTYGTGDGSTTFNVPDVRGRTVAGKDNMGGTAANRMPGWVLGTAGGEFGHTLTIAETPSHTHTGSVTVSGNTGGRSAAHTHSVTLYDSAAWSANVFAMGRGAGAAVGTGTIPAETGDHTHGFSGSASFTTSAQGSNNAFALVQPTIAANYIIYAGV